LDVDFVFDMCFLFNLYWVEELRLQSGFDDLVCDYVFV